MTSLAGIKIREFRERQEPKLTREQFGLRFTPPINGATVNGWETHGKRPRSARVEAQIARDGIALLNDWHLPAECALCTRRADAPDVRGCRVADCPIAARLVA